MCRYNGWDESKFASAVVASVPMRSYVSLCRATLLANMSSRARWSPMPSGTSGGAEKPCSSP